MSLRSAPTSTVHFMMLDNHLTHDWPTADRAPDVEIVIPVYNEEDALGPCITRLTSYLHDAFPFSWVVTIADNASTDTTLLEAQRLSSEIAGVAVLHLDRKGRGRALKAAWSKSEANVVAYMDVDLSTDLSALLPLVAPLISLHSDVAIGSRLAPGSRVRRGAKRELISRSYNTILHATLATRFSDAQCGFKAVRREVADELLPLIEDDEWFFDTELLALAERNGLRVAEVPVDWVDDPDSSVAVASTARDDLAGVWRLIRSFTAGEGTIPDNALRAYRPSPGLATQVVPFAAVGLVTTVLFAVAFVALASSIGMVGADIVALALATAINLAGNRRLTFAQRGPDGMARHYVAGALVSVIPLSLNLIALGIAALVAPGSILVALVAVTIANLLATVARFLFLRRWVFAPAR